MHRPTAPTLLLSVLGLSLASFTFACSGASADNSDVDSSQLAVQKKDGKPTGNGSTCSWDGVAPVAPMPIPNVGAPPPSSGGSSGGCNTDADGTYRCWSYDSEGREVGIKPSPGSSTSSTGGVSSSSSSGSSGGSSGSSGGCSTDEQGNYKCWSYPSEPEPRPPVMPPPPPPVSETYELGDWFPSIDGCNRCTCTSIGIMCTVQVCAAPPPPPPSKGCELDGKWFAAGDRFPSPDSCNSCSCGPDGQVFCTEMGCVDPTPPSPLPAPTPKR